MITMIAINNLYRTLICAVDWLTYIEIKLVCNWSIYKNSHLQNNQNTILARLESFINILNKQPRLMRRKLGAFIRNYAPILKKKARSITVVSFIFRTGLKIRVFPRLGKSANLKPPRNYTKNIWHCTCNNAEHYKYISCLSHYFRCVLTNTFINSYISKLKHCHEIVSSKHNLGYYIKWGLIQTIPMLW
jgi:hypothetical protein